MKKITLVAVTTAMLLSSVGTIETTTVSAAATVQLKDGVLLSKATGKPMKGYKVYKGCLYKDGSLAPGRVKYGSGKNLKLYRNGQLEKGLYITRDYKYAFKDGKLIQGKSFFVGELNDLYYQDGVLTKRIFVNSNEKLYENKSIKKGDYVIGYFYDNDHDYYNFNRLRLYTNGILSKGYHFAGYKKKTYLFKDGRISQAMLYKGKLYEKGLPAPKNKVISDGRSTYYYNNMLADGSIDGYIYENGKRIRSVSTQNYLEQLDKVKKLSTVSKIDSAVLNTKIAELLKNYTEHFDAIFGDYVEWITEDESDSHDAYLTLTVQMNDLKKIIGKLEHTDATIANDKAIREKLDFLYGRQEIEHANGEILDGEYKGNIYRKGELVGSREDVALENATKAFEKVSTDKSATIQQKIDALTAQVLAANVVFTAAKAPEYPNVKFDTKGAERVLRDSKVSRRALVKEAAQQQETINTDALEKELIAGFAELNEKISFDQPSATATYEPLAVNEEATGTFDDKGFAYYAINVDQVEGNYYFTGNADVPNQVFWMSDAKEKINDVDEEVPEKLRYLEKGMRYVAVQGEPNAPYHFKLYQKIYNYTTMAELLPGRDGAVELPYYQHSTPSVDLNLTTDKHIMLYALENENSFESPIENLILTNKETGETYPVVKISRTFFSTNAPNGKYSLSMTSTKKGVPGHVGIYYETSPQLKMNEPNQNNRFYTLNVEKDTKFKFVLTSNHTQYGNNKMRFYDQNHKLIKHVPFDTGDKPREFVYTVKKGRYSISMDDPSITITATLK
ncbi:hypothetical protein [Rummeliibacillus sp. BSL5]